MYRFGEFKLDSSIPTLRHANNVISLTPKVLQTLLVLIEHRDRVVSKEEFHQQLWPGIFIEENALAQNIYLLRKP
jgi:DNA-binding winged helix-turn-helix (wHTH) protein